MKRPEIMERLSKAVWTSDIDGHAPDDALTPAAVLTPLVDRPEGFTVLLTKRTSNLKHHPGQICFPGGQVEDGDETMISTALRETTEEIGLDGKTIQVIGRLDDCTTITGFTITPIVGIVSVPLDLHIDPHEVAFVFEVPLAFVLDPANHRSMMHTHNGAQRISYAFPFGEHTIWGATACMLMNLYRVLSAP